MISYDSRRSLDTIGVNDDKVMSWWHHDVSIFFSKSSKIVQNGLETVKIVTVSHKNMNMTQNYQFCRVKSRFRHNLKIQCNWAVVQKHKICSNRRKIGNFRRLWHILCFWTAVTLYFQAISISRFYPTKSIILSQNHIFMTYCDHLNSFQAISNNFGTFWKKFSRHHNVITHHWL